MFPSCLANNSSGLGRLKQIPEVVYSLGFWKRNLSCWNFSLHMLLTTLIPAIINNKAHKAHNQRCTSKSSCWTGINIIQLHSKDLLDLIVLNSQPAWSVLHISHLFKRIQADRLLLFAMGHQNLDMLVALPDRSVFIMLLSWQKECSSTKCSSGSEGDFNHNKLYIHKQQKVRAKCSQLPINL